MSPSTVGRGEEAFSEPVAIGCEDAKLNAKRKRQSQKPKTTIIEATPDKFCSTVQWLTGNNKPSFPTKISCRQPRRPPLNSLAMRVDAERNGQYPPARLDSSSPAMFGSLVSNRVPGQKFLDRVSSSSGSPSGGSSLNCTMGYQHRIFRPFPEHHQKQLNSTHHSVLPHEYGYAQESNAATRGGTSLGLHVGDSTSSFREQQKGGYTFWQQQ